MGASAEPVSQTTIIKIWVAREGPNKQDSRGDRQQWPAGSISPPRPVRRTTIGCVRLFSAPCFDARCCSRIADTTRTDQGACPLAGAAGHIPPKRNRKNPICFSPYLYGARNLIERFFNKIKQCRCVAIRYDKLAANYPHLAAR
jgi:transposase